MWLACRAFPWAKIVAAAAQLEVELETGNCQLRTLNWEWSRAAGKFICGFPRCTPTPAQQLRLQLGNSGWPLRKSLRKPNNSGNKMVGRGWERRRETNCHRRRWCRWARQISTISVINLPFQSLPVIERQLSLARMASSPSSSSSAVRLSCWWFLINWPAGKPNRPPHMDTAKSARVQSFYWPGFLLN